MYKCIFNDIKPSTGMDPEARRNMWNVIEQVSDQRSVILVSHSMEEVEALCTRMGVMVSGRLQCLGSAQHLKNRFGMGYQIEIRCLASRADDCIALFKSMIPLATIDEVHGGYMRFKVQCEFDLAQTFHELESAKPAYNIFDYSISQCTLEQVFIQFAKDQEEEKHQVNGNFNSMKIPLSLGSDDNQGHANAVDHRSNVINTSLYSSILPNDSSDVNDVSNNEEPANIQITSEDYEEILEPEEKKENEIV